MWSVDYCPDLNTWYLDTSLFTLEEHMKSVSVFSVNLSYVPFGICLDSAVVSVSSAEFQVKKSKPGCNT